MFQSLTTHACLTATLAVASTTAVQAQFASFTDTFDAGMTYMETSTAVYTTSDGTAWPYGGSFPGGPVTDDGHLEVVFSGLGDPYIQLGTFEYDAQGGKLPGFGAGYLFTRVTIDGWMWPDRTGFDAGKTPGPYNTLESAVIAYGRNDPADPWVDLSLAWGDDNGFSQGDAILGTPVRYLMVEVYTRPEEGGRGNDAWTLDLQSVKLDGSIPEPATAALLGLAAAMVGRRRR